MSIPAAFRDAAEELAALAETLDAAALETACEQIAGAGRIMAYGCGREGLQLSGFAMRLHHLGLQVAMQGDMAAPPLGPGDLFLTSAGPGQLSTVTALCRTARQAGARVLYFTAEPDAVPDGLADHLVVIQAQTMARDRGAAATLPMGSVYEGALFLVFEAMILRLMELTGETAGTMRARHTNME